MPDFNNEYGKLVEQAQKKAQEQAKIQNDAATTTQEYLAPDKSFSFDYRSNWQTATQPIGSGKPMFSAYKTNGLSLLASAFLIVKDAGTKNENDAIEQYKNFIWAQNQETKISEYKTTNGSQIIQVIEFGNAGTSSTTQTPEQMEKTAFISTNGKVYLISVTIMQNIQDISREADDIFKSISITEQGTAQTTNP